MQKRVCAVALTAALLSLAACAAPAPIAPTAVGPTSAPAAQSPAATKPPVDATRPLEPTSAAPTATRVAKKGGDFKEADIADAKSFHIYQTTDTTSRNYAGNVYASGLWTYDPNTLRPIPNMAESWDVSADATTYTFHLRKDLKWSDGQPLTAQDYTWTYQQISNPANNYPYLENLSDIAAYKALDNYTIQVSLKQGICTGLEVADAVTPPLPEHVWSKYDWSDPTKNPEIQAPSVVSGLFKLKEWKKDDHATFERNDLYYRGAPNFDTDTVRIIPNQSVQFQMLKTGEIDYAKVSPADYAEAKTTSLLKEYNWDPASATWHYIGINLRRPWLKDVEVRHALAYATPRDAIAEKVYQGLAKPTYSAFTPTSWAYNPNVPHYEYSTDKAKQTLQAAGYKWDASGKLLQKDGTLFPKLKLLFNTGNTRNQQIMTVAQAEYKKLGIDSDLTGMESQAYLTYIKTEPFDYDLYVLAWQATIEPYFMYQIWSESTIPSLNAVGYVNKEVETLFAQSNRPPCDTDSRKQIFQKIQNILTTDSPYIFLTYDTGYDFYNKRVVVNPPTALGVGYAPEQWYLNAP